MSSGESGELEQKTRQRNDIGPAQDGTGEPLAPRAVLKLSGVVQKLVPGVGGIGHERVQIEVRGADDLYCELRVDNALKDAEGNKVKLAPGAELEIVIKVRPGGAKAVE